VLRPSYTGSSGATVDSNCEGAARDLLDLNQARNTSPLGVAKSSIGSFEYSSLYS
jgi:hypothetical protein